MKRVIENALNQYLALDAASKERLAALENKIVQIELHGVDLSLQLFFQERRIQLHWQSSERADLTISGTPLNLLHMGLVPQQRQRFFAEDVKIEGDLELAQYVLAIFDELEIDWEEISSQYIGDVSAHHLGRFVRGLKKMGQQFQTSFLQNVNEYVHEEINLVPANEALRDFFNEVDDLRMAVDRLEARVAHAINSLNRGLGTP